MNHPPELVDRVAKHLDELAVSSAANAAAPGPTTIRGDAEAWEAVCSVIADRGPVAPGVPEGHVHDGCEEHYTEPGACCPHCPGWAV